MKKIAIFDWDVHCGDGTAEVFKEDDSVLYMSIHRFDRGDFYPGSVGRADKIGEGKGAGFNIQFPFDVIKNDTELVGDRDYIYACEKVFFPVIKEFEPEIIIISAGFDSAKGDPLGQVGVTPVGYAYITAGLRSLCSKSRVSVVLEGGYNYNALAVSSMAVIKTLLTDPNSE